MCGVCVWLVLMSLRLRGLLVGGWPCRVFLRTRPAVVPLRVAGVARVCVASGWALRSGTCRPGCALVGAASYTNGLGMALLSPSMCRSSRERRGRCLMGMDRYAVLLIFNSVGAWAKEDNIGTYKPTPPPPQAPSAALTTCAAACASASVPALPSSLRNLAGYATACGSEPLQVASGHVRKE